MSERNFGGEDARSKKSRESFGPKQVLFGIDFKRDQVVFWD